MTCEVIPVAIPNSNSITRGEDEDDYTVWVVVEHPYKDYESGPPSKAWVNRRIGWIEKMFQRSKNVQLEIPAGRTVMAAASSVEDLIDLDIFASEGTFRGRLSFTFRDWRPGEE